MYILCGIICLPVGAPSERLAHLYEQLLGLLDREVVVELLVHQVYVHIYTHIYHTYTCHMYENATIRMHMYGIHVCKVI